MTVIFKISIIILSLMLSNNILAKEVSVALQAETWDISRHGEVLLKVPALSQVMKKWMLNPQQKIELRYPGGEEGELWVEELKGWLVALGVPSNVIQISPGSHAEDVIDIVLLELQNKKTENNKLESHNE